MSAVGDTSDDSVLLKPRALRQALQAVMGSSTSSPGGAEGSSGQNAGDQGKQAPGTPSALSASLISAEKRAQAAGVGDARGDSSSAASDFGGIAALVATSAGDLLASSSSGQSFRSRERLLGALCVNIWSEHARVQAVPFPGLSSSASLKDGSEAEDGTARDPSNSPGKKKTSDSDDASSAASGDNVDGVPQSDEGKDDGAEQVVDEVEKPSAEDGGSSAEADAGADDDGADDASNLQCLCLDCEEGKVAITSAGNFLIVVYGSGLANFGLLREKAMALRKNLRQPLQRLSQ